jgi:hypothetical protein
VRRRPRRRSSRARRGEHSIRAPPRADVDASSSSRHPSIAPASRSGSVGPPMDGYELDRGATAFGTRVMDTRRRARVRDRTSE